MGVAESAVARVARRLCDRLLAVPLAANAIVFSVADSIVFHRIPYPDADRLVEIQRRDPRSGRSDSQMSVDLLDRWRQQTDLFSDVEGSLTKSLFLAGNGEPQIVATADVTVGMFELLGAHPYWGRSFAPGDERQLDLQPVLIAEALSIGPCLRSRRASHAYHRE